MEALLEPDFVLIIDDTEMTSTQPFIILVHEFGKIPKRWKRPVHNNCMGW